MGTKGFLARWARNTLASLIGSLFPLKKISAHKVREALLQKQIRKVLLLRPHQGLGDLLLATPLIRALKEQTPHLDLHFLASDYLAVAVRRNPHLQKVWVWNKKAMWRPWRLVGFMRRLRAEHFDLAIVISSHIPSFTSFLIARASGAKMVWAYSTEVHYEGANWSRWLAHVEIPNPPADMPEYAKFMELIRPLGGFEFRVSSFELGEGEINPKPETRNPKLSFEPEFFLGEEEMNWAKVRWETLRTEGKDAAAWIGLFLGGNPDRSDRLWSAESWARLAQMLLKENDISVAAIVPPRHARSGSGTLEPGIYKEFSERLGISVPLFSESDLTKVAAFLKGLQLFICPDGGLLHVAVAAHAPTLGLFVKTDPQRWLPPVSWASFVRAPNQDARQLRPEDVYQKAMEMVNLICLKRI